MLVRCLFKQFNSDTDLHEPLVFNGVAVPAPWSDQTLVRLMHEISLECNSKFPCPHCKVQKAHI